MSKAFPPASSNEELVVRIVPSNGSQSRRGSAEHIYFVFFQDSPEGTCIGGANRLPVEEHSCSAS